MVHLSLSELLIDGGKKGIIVFGPCAMVHHGVPNITYQSLPSSAGLIEAHIEQRLRQSCSPNRLLLHQMPPLNWVYNMGAGASFGPECTIETIWNDIELLADKVVNTINDPLRTYLLVYAVNCSVTAPSPGRRCAIAIIVFGQ